MHFLNKRRLFIFLIGFIIVAALIGFSLNDREELSTPEQMVKDAVGWVQNIIHTPVNYIVNTFSNVKHIKNTYEENIVLKEKISEYKSLVYEIRELKEDNEELRSILDKTESLSDFSAIQATVMSRSPERWIEQVTINKGTQHGVKDNMAVITADGMVGKIQSTSSFTSTVQLLSGFDQFNRISAMVSREDDKDIFGLIEDFDKDVNSLKMKIIDESEADIEEGDKVMSSGMGGVFPSGLTIGTVEEVIPDKYGLSITALIEPSASMYKVNHVIVVDRSLGDQGGESEGEEGDESD